MIRAISRRATSIESLCGSEQLTNRLSVIQDCDRTTGEILVGHLGVDPEVVVDGRQQVLRRERPLGGVLGFRVRGTDHLAHLQSATGNQRRVGLRPVIPAGFAVVGADPGRAAELADGHHHDPLVEPPVEPTGIVRSDRDGRQPPDGRPSWRRCRADA